MTTLDPALRRELRARAHHLHPVVSVGNHGLTPAVLHELDVNLLAHELIKVRLFSDDRTERETLLARICAELDAAPVQHLGKVLVIYRPAPQDDPEPTPARKTGKPKPGRAQPRPDSGQGHRRGELEPIRRDARGGSGAKRGRATAKGAGGRATPVDKTRVARRGAARGLARGTDRNADDASGGAGAGARTGRRLAGGKGSSAATAGGAARTPTAKKGGRPPGGTPTTSAPRVRRRRG